MSIHFLYSYPRTNLVLTHAQILYLPTHKSCTIFYNYNNYYFIALSICLFLTVDPEDGKTDIHKMSNQKERAEALSFFSSFVLFLFFW